MPRMAGRLRRRQEAQRRGRAWRRDATQRVIRQRVNFLFREWTPSLQACSCAVPRHRLPGHLWYKRHPWDCGQTRCIVCHTEKVLGQQRRDEWEADLERQEWSDDDGGR